MYSLKGLISIGLFFALFGCTNNTLLIQSQFKVQTTPPEMFGHREILGNYLYATGPSLLDSISMRYFEDGSLEHYRSLGNNCWEIEGNAVRIDLGTIINQIYGQNPESKGAISLKLNWYSEYSVERFSVVLPPLLTLDSTFYLDTTTLSISISAKHKITQRGLDVYLFKGNSIKVICNKDIQKVGIAKLTNESMSPFSQQNDTLIELSGNRRFRLDFRSLKKGIGDFGNTNGEKYLIRLYGPWGQDLLVLNFCGAPPMPELGNSIWE